MRGHSGSRAAAVGLILGFVQLLVLAVPSPLAAQTVTVLELPTNDIIYDPVSRRIYASVPSSAGPERGDTITTINPVTAEIENSVFIGSEPRELAVSDDGKYLYVGLDGAGAIRRYDIATATPGLQIDLGADEFDRPHTASDIEVLPGNPNAIAVARRSYTLSLDIMIFDDDIMRPETIAPDFPTDPLAPLSSRIEFSDTAETLYGVMSRVRRFELQIMAVTPTGVSEVAVLEGLVGEDDIKYVDGSIFTRHGVRLDPASGAILGLYAPTTHSGRFAPTEPDPASGQVYRIDDGMLMTYDLETFRLMRTVEVPAAGLDLVRWDPDGLAVNAFNMIYLISELPPPVREPVCDFELSQAVYLDGEAITASRVRFANPGGRPLVVETKLWAELPGQELLSMNHLNPGGLLDLPPGFDQDFGPVPLHDVTPDLPRGTYQFNCQLIDPATGAFMTLDKNSFEIR